VKNEERIATGLLGWDEILCGESAVWEEHQVDGPLYRKNKTEVWIEPRSQAWYRRTHPNCQNQENWPNFATLDGARLFEDALAERSLLGEYRKALLDLTKLHEPVALFPANSMSWACWVMLRATPEQRVAACIAVMDEAGL